jgi:hypothetical protein
MLSTLTGVIAMAALVVVAVLRGKQPYEETMVVPGSPDEWLQKCSDALEGAPLFSELRVYDDPLQVQARYRRRPGVWGRLTVTLGAGSTSSTQITARATVAPTPFTAIRRPEPEIVGQLARQLGLDEPHQSAAGRSWIGVG